MHVVDTGAGRAVVLGHGITQDQSTFDAQRAALEDRYRVITWDAPQHGRSPAVAALYRHDVLADDIADELRRRGVEKAVVGGSSQGGWIGLHLALRHPELVEGLILLSCTASAHPGPAVAPVRAAAQQWAAGDCGDYAQWSAEQNFGPGHPAVELWRDRWRSEDGYRYLDAHEAMLTRPNLLPRLGDVEVPALVMRGEHDPWVPADEVQAMADALPRSTFITVAGAWHTFIVTHPEETNAALAAFLDEL